ncbi:MAG: glycogen/starch synthase [Bacteroidaceae bacterium]|nr:glycogen/starch synthase [Bacteroidaceae bacterium]
MEKKRILYISSEIFPFVSESEISGTCRNLLFKMQDAGHEIRTFMPKWGPINERRNQLHEVIRLSGMNLIIDDTDHPLLIKVASLPSARLQVYFIDNDDFFQNHLFTNDRDGTEYPDNDERTIFFARGVLETVKKLRWNPDVIHCFGWMSALIPLYIKTGFSEEPAFRDSKVVFSICDEGFNNNFSDNYKEKLLTRNMTSGEIGTFAPQFGYVELMKKAIEFSDGVVKHSKNADKNLFLYAGKLKKAKIDCSTHNDEENKLEAFYESLF